MTAQSNILRCVDTTTAVALTRGLRAAPPCQRCVSSWCYQYQQGASLFWCSIRIALHSGAWRIALILKSLIIGHYLVLSQTIGPSNSVELAGALPGFRQEISLCPTWRHPRLNLKPSAYKASSGWATALPLQISIFYLPDIPCWKDVFVSNVSTHDVFKEQGI